MDQALRSFQNHGYNCRLIRPPFGKITCFSILQTFLRNKKFGWWTLDSNDANPREEPIDSLIDRISQVGGGVVLMHDFDNGRDEQRVKFVLDATQAILEFARKNEYNILPLGKLMDLD